MAYWTRKEVCDKIGVKQATITMAVNRNHIEITESGMIDIDNTKNAAWLEKQRRLVEQKQQSGGKKGRTKKKPTKKGKKKSPDPSPEPPSGNEPQQTGGNVTGNGNKKTKAQETFEEKEQADIAVKWASYELKVAEIEKRKGNNLPKELVTRVFSQYMKNINDENLNSAEKIVTDFASRVRMSDEQKAQMREMLLNEFNDNAQRVAEETKKELSKLSNQVSEERGRGEKRKETRIDTQ